MNSIANVLKFEVDKFHEKILKSDYFSIYYKPIKRLNDEIFGLQTIVKISPTVCQSFDGVSPIRNLSDFYSLCNTYGLNKEHMSNVLEKLRSDFPYLRTLKTMKIVTFNVGSELLDEELNMEMQSLIEYSSVCKFKLGCELKNNIDYDNGSLLEYIYDSGMECLIVNTEIKTSEVLKFISLGLVTFGAGYVKVKNERDIKDDEYLNNMKSLVNVCKKMGKKVILTNVETASCLSFAKEIGVDFVQGFYVGRPVTALDYYAKWSSDDLCFNGVHEQ